MKKRLHNEKFDFSCEWPCWKNLLICHCFRKDDILKPKYKTKYVVQGSL